MFEEIELALPKSFRHILSPSGYRSCYVHKLLFVRFGADEPKSRDIPRVDRCTCNVFS